MLRNVIVRNSYTTLAGSWQINVEDSTGSIRVFVPSSVARGVGFSIPRTNIVISVAGYRDVYGSIEEIVVFSEVGIRVENITMPTTPSATPTFIPIEVSQVSQYVDKNVSFVGVLSKVKYVDRMYYIDPTVVGWKSVFRINGTVRDPATAKLFSIEVIESKSPLIVNVKQVLNIEQGVLVMLVDDKVVSSCSRSGTTGRST